MDCGKLGDKFCTIKDFLPLAPHDFTLPEKIPLTESNYLTKCLVLPFVDHTKERLDINSMYLCIDDKISEVIRINGRISNIVDNFQYRLIRVK